MLITQVLAANVRELRKTLGLTQSELAARVGVSLPFIQNIEGARTWVGAETVSELARSLRVSETRLFAEPSSAKPTAAAAPDARDVVHAICTALGMHAPEVHLKRARFNGRKMIDLGTLPEDIYEKLVGLCRTPECEWEQLRKAFERSA